MRARVPVLVGGFVVLALGIAFLTAHADENEAKPGILKMAAMLEKGDPDVKKVAEEVNKVGLNEAMGLMKLRNKDGLGFGAKPGKDPSKDGIEVKIQNLGKKELTKAELKDQAADIEKAAYITAAIAHISELNVPKKAMGDKTPKAWQESTADMKQGALDLAAAVKKGDPAQIKKVASKLNSSCNNCHGVFRE